jgi:RNA polymerase sigma factor (sigma-70 family)
MKPDPRDIVADPEVRAFLRRKARRYCRLAADPAVSPHDVEQDLVEQLLRRLPAYDSGRGTAVGFAILVALHAIADLVRARATAKRHTWPGRLDDRAADRLDRDRRRNTAPDRTEEQRDLTLDLTVVLEALPPHLREVADLLMTDSVANAARRLGKSRSTIYGRLARLRERFEDAGLAPYLPNRASLRRPIG